METPKLYNNTTGKVVDGLKADLQSGSRLSIAAASFSIYAYQALKEELENIAEEGNEIETNCHDLKMRAADGKNRMTDVADVEQLFRIIQSIPSPKAEPFKLWMASAANGNVLDNFDQLFANYSPDTTCKIL